MEHLNQYIIEKFKIKKDINISDGNNQAQYASNWQWFNSLITNVNLEEDQLRDIFSNLKDDELKVWIKEVQDCYVGTDQEDDANKIGDHIDLARFYYQNPVTE